MSSITEIGSLALFPHGLWAPRDWMFCDGQILQSDDYYALKALFYDKYGGDGSTTFALPKLADIKNFSCRHIIRTVGDFPANFRGELSFFKPTSDPDYNLVGLITESNGNIPEGWLPCDGREFDVKAEPSLTGIYSVIGPVMRVKELESKFQIPNLNSIGTKKYVICVEGRHAAP